MKYISAQTVAVQGRKYATQTYMSQIRLSDTLFQKNTSALERYTLDFKQYGSTDTVEIPVVFHVVYSGAVPPVTTADIQAQLAQLNVDFFTPAYPYKSDDAYTFGSNESLVYLQPADKYEDYASKAAFPMIRFCFPQFDPQGDSTSGILFVSSAVQNWGLDKSLKNSNLGGSKPWDTQKYCNIWVTSLTGGMAGYAQMPGADAATDGIVIDQKYFQRADGSVPPDAGGKDFALGRTLVHLMGSYLNLYELWNDEIPCTDDFVEDTPIHNAPNYGKSEYKHVTTCEGNAVEMTMNLMDSGCDTTMYMFTWGQVARMQATLSDGGLRARLTKNATRCNKDDKKRSEERSENDLISNAAFQVRTVPNPNSGDFTIEIQTNEASGGEALIQVLNSSGKLLLERKNLLLPSSTSRIPVLGYRWPDGVYFVRVTTANDIQVKKVIINQ